MTRADAVLIAGYALAVPVTVFVPGFLRLWRRREAVLFGSAESGAALVVLGWTLRDRPLPAVANAGWLVGFTAAWVVEGRRRARKERRAG